MSRCGFTFYSGEHAPEHLQSGIDPACLVDRRGAVALDARDEQHDQDTLATAQQRRPPTA